MISFVRQSMTLLCTNKFAWCNLAIGWSFVCIPFPDIKALLSTVAKPKCPSFIWISKFHANVWYQTRWHVSSTKTITWVWDLCNCREKTFTNSRSHAKQSKQRVAVHGIGITKSISCQITSNIEYREVCYSLVWITIHLVSFFSSGIFLRLHGT